MFPYDVEEGEEILKEEESEPKEYEIDFVTGQLTGRVVTGLEALKVWAWLAVNTERYKYQQYSWDYGAEIDILIGQPPNEDEIIAQAEEMLEGCLTIHPNIRGVEDVKCVIQEEKVSLLCTIITDYGEGGVNV